MKFCHINFIYLIQVFNQKNLKKSFIQALTLIVSQRIQAKTLKVICIFQVLALNLWNTFKV